MNNAYSLRSGCRAIRVSLISTLLVLAGCSTSKQLSDSQSALQQCLANQQSTQQQLVQQGQLVQGVEQLRLQLAAQQTLLESEPRVIEKQTTRIECPNPAPVPPPRVMPQESMVVDKLIVGLQEQVLLEGLNIFMPTRINPNAANSVVDARNIQLFERNSEEWVRFTVFNPETKEPHVLERKRLRFQSVTTANAANERRPVVEMRFTIGKLTQRGEFILADRSNSEFPLLIGRNLLRDVMLVDVSGNNLAPVQRLEESSESRSQP